MHYLMRIKNPASIQGPIRDTAVGHIGQGVENKHVRLCSLFRPSEEFYPFKAVDKLSKKFLKGMV